ncbi:hypothetical protein [Bhargavaea beijingensis]|uniref:hypothetical protein n=1 Tax=Bhargavaea beijingensis TaxID=426756 RepID=UPI002225939F|nr:hypothetical protein [Bhargavaea beijingensis]MCW1927364.1 hypothetical protein [Bhargavaea beijingensis]
MDEYKSMITETINEIYPKYLQKKVIKKLEANNIISTTKDLLSEAEVTIDTSEEGEFEKIKKAIEQNDDSLTLIENLEYENSYKYAALFDCDTEDLHEQLESAIKGKFILDANDESFSHDLCSSFSEEEKIIPTYKLINGIYCLKFSNKLTGYLPMSGDNRRIVKYPIIVLLYKDVNTLEIRLDKIKGFLKNGDEYFYLKQFQYVVEWLKENLNLNIEAMNLAPVIDFIINPLESEDQTSEVVVTAQAMNLATGSKAILDTGVNDQFILPLLGELKNLIRDNGELFNSNEETKEIKGKLDTFIFETEETAHLPWISLTWKNENKSKAVKVKFSFNYLGQEFSLLQYYGNNAEMERMNNVTKYIIENKRKYLSQES